MDLKFSSFSSTIDALAIERRERVRTRRNRTFLHIRGALFGRDKTNAMFDVREKKIVDAES